MSYTLSLAKSVYNICIPQYHFPKWVLNANLWNTFEFNKTVVYYDTESDVDDVIKMVRQREPCNISMRRIYLKDEMQQVFGWKHGAYELSTPEKLMPNIAVYCYATVLLSTGCYTNIHVINLVGYAFDHMHQPDYQYFQEKPLQHLVKKYCRVWTKALYAAMDLQRQGKIDKIKIFNVGGGAFAGKFHEKFIETIFEPAFLPLLPFFEQYGIQVLGYDTKTKTFNGGYIPDVLEDEDEDVWRTLYVNAWDPWSLIGNGNERDNSLDGYWGRISNMAILGWSVTNPDITYRATGCLITH